MSMFTIYAVKAFARLIDIIYLKYITWIYRIFGVINHVPMLLVNDITLTTATEALCFSNVLTKIILIEARSAKASWKFISLKS